MRLDSDGMSTVSDDLFSGPFGHSASVVHILRKYLSWQDEFMFLFKFIKLVSYAIAASVHVMIFREMK